MHQRHEIPECTPRGWQNICQDCLYKSMGQLWEIDRRTGCKKLGSECQAPRAVAIHMVWILSLCDVECFLLEIEFIAFCHVDYLKLSPIQTWQDKPWVRKNNANGSFSCTMISVIMINITLYISFVPQPLVRTLGRSWNHRTRTPSQLDIRVTRLPRARQLAGSLKAKRVGSGVLDVHEMTNKNTMITVLGQRIWNQYQRACSAHVCACSAHS